MVPHDWLSLVYVREHVLIYALRSNREGEEKVNHRVESLTVVQEVPQVVAYDRE
jgi:hypothetical protein